MDERGQIVLAQPASDGPYPELSGGQATTFARAWAQQFAPYHDAFLTRTRGAPIDYQRLTPCGRPLYARAAFDPPSPDVPAPVRRAYGPWWLVTLCSRGGTPELSVAVSAWATDMRLEGGAIRFASPGPAGGEFFGLGIPAGHTGEYPASPEVAVTHARRGSGRYVAAVPELVMASPDQAPPQGAHWALPLDAPARLGRSGGKLVTDSRVFVGAHEFATPRDTLFVASEAQPEGVTIVWATPPNPGEGSAAYLARRQYVQTTVSRRRDTPIRFDRATSPEGR